MKKIGALTIIILSLTFLCGCWDMVEINERLFVSSIGVDLNEGEDIDKYIVTYSYPNINAIGKDASDSKGRFVVSTPASGIFTAGKNFSTKVEYPFYYKHVKVLIIGEELAREDNMVREIIDALNRDTKINKKVQVLIADGKAEDILEEIDGMEYTIEGAIYNILKNSKSSSKFTAKTLTEIISDSDFCCVTLVPKISKKHKNVQISGGAILDNYKFKDWISPKENRALAFMTDKITTELIDVPYEDCVISYNITGGDVVKKVTLDKEISVNINIDLEGYLQSYTIGKKERVEDDVLKDMEKAIDKKIKDEINHTIKVLQKEQNSDLIGVGEYISKFYPKQWKELEPKWREMFPEVKFNVSVNSIIKRTGLTN